MKSRTNQRDALPLSQVAIGYVQTQQFNLDLSYRGESVVQTSLVQKEPGDPDWECCRLVPGAYYEYTRVSLKNPESRGSSQKRIERAREKVMQYIKLKEEKESVLRIVQDTIVVKLSPILNDSWHVEVIDLQVSHECLNVDKIASQRTTREMPAHLKEMTKGA